MPQQVPVDATLALWATEYGDFQGRLAEVTTLTVTHDGTELSGTLERFVRFEGEGSTEATLLWHPDEPLEEGEIYAFELEIDAPQELEYAPPTAGEFEVVASISFQSLSLDGVETTVTEAHGGERVCCTVVPETSGACGGPTEPYEYCVANQTHQVATIVARHNVPFGAPWTGYGFYRRIQGIDGVADRIVGPQLGVTGYDVSATFDTPTDRICVGVQFVSYHSGEVEDEAVVCRDVGFDPSVYTDHDSFWPTCQDPPVWEDRGEPFEGEYNLVDDGSGCSVGPQRRGAPVCAVLVLLGLIARRRRVSA